MVEQAGELQSVHGIQETSSSSSSKEGSLKEAHPQEGRLTRQVEQATAQIPSLGYFSAAMASMGMSLGLACFSRRKDWATFVGLWTPTFLLMGIYNKLVKNEFERGRVRQE